jgi:hypothetical protein
MAEDVSSARKVGAIVLAALGQVLFVVSLVFLLLTFEIYSRMGTYAILAWVVFLPALILFILFGALAAATGKKLNAVFFYENLALLVVSILGMLFLAFAIADNDNLFQPDYFDFESVIMFFIFVVAPTGIGVAISRSFYQKPARLEISSYGLFILWIMTNVIANFAWSLSFSVIELAVGEALYAVSSLVASLLAGILAGVLQFLLLAFVIRTANRWLLAAWVPITVFGWVLVSLVYILIPDGILDVVFVLLISVLIGLLQWLLLRKYGQAAFLWIPALLIDAVLVSLLVGIYVYGDFIGDFVSGVVGSIASATAIAYILRQYLVTAPEGAGGVPGVELNPPDFSEEG